mmetsp:Transcript_41829/g.131071  ORF Transcript_41829/g.131071 Transcript_41829/m.131071 type:complete len:276 (+) Transcript_41829:430-1257(+)
MPLRPSTMTCSVARRTPRKSWPPPWSASRTLTRSARRPSPRRPSSRRCRCATVRMCAGAFFFRRVQRRWQAHEEWPRLQASATGRLLRVAYYEDGVALLPLVDLNATGAGMEDWLQVFKDITEAFMSEWERIIGSTKHLTDDEAATGIPGLCGLLEHLEQQRRRSADDVVEVFKEYTWTTAGRRARPTFFFLSRRLKKSGLEDVKLPMEEGLEYHAPASWVEQVRRRRSPSDPRQCRGRTRGCCRPSMRRPAPRHRRQPLRPRRRPRAAIGCRCR